MRKAILVLLILGVMSVTSFSIDDPGPPGEPGFEELKPRAVRTLNKIRISSFNK